jgi:general secretion pathway protein D
VALSDIGFTKLQQNDLARAREYFEQALKIDPNNAAALINLAQVCERQGKKAEAESLYRRVLALPPPKGAQEGQVDPLKELAREGLLRVQGKRAGT